MNRPLADKHGYRGVEYALYETKAGEWEWACSPKVGQAIKTSGTAKGDKEAARAACYAAIDAWLGPVR